MTIEVSNFPNVEKKLHSLLGCTEGKLMTMYLS